MKTLFTLLLFILTLYLNAQNPDLKRTTHWYFGNKCGLDFSSGQPVADTNSVMAVQSNCAVMSDTSGNLLFYTDGITVWNKNHTKMLNGDTIGVGQFAQPRNRCVIVPKPENDSLYYIFTVDGAQHQRKNGLMYTIVNVKRNSGLGEVMTKDNQLFTPAAEILATTKDATGCGYWIASHTWRSDSFMVYHLTKVGLDTTPVVIRVGSNYSIPQQFASGGGGYNLKFSPNGELAAILVEFHWGVFHQGYDSIDFFKFNNSNGVFFNPITIGCDTTLNLGMSFSPNGKLFYTEEGYYRAIDYQYNLSAFNLSSILASKTVIYNPHSNIA
jgi:hypothetical protein